MLNEAQLPETVNATEATQQITESETQQITETETQPALQPELKKHTSLMKDKLIVQFWNQINISCWLMRVTMTMPTTF